MQAPHPRVWAQLAIAVLLLSAITALASQEEGEQLEVPREGQSRLRAKGIKCSDFTSASGQDVFVSIFLEGMEGGFFMDLGAQDGVGVSNSIFLERHLGWGGLCVEHAEGGFRRRGGNEAGRQCTKVDAAIVQHRGECELPEERAKSRLAEQPVRCVTHGGWMQGYEVPRVVDFLSLDMRGRELTFLQLFPFDNHQIRVICLVHGWNLDGVEHGQVDTLLQDKGYTRVVKDHPNRILFPNNKTRDHRTGGVGGGGYEDWYVHREYLEVLTMRRPGICDEFLAEYQLCFGQEGAPKCNAHAALVAGGGVGANIVAKLPMGPGPYGWGAGGWRLGGHDAKVGAFLDPNNLGRNPCERCWVVGVHHPDVGLGCSVFEVLNAAATAVGMGCGFAVQENDPGLWSEYLLEIQAEPWSYVEGQLRALCPDRLTDERVTFHLQMSNQAPQVMIPQIGSLLDLPVLREVPRVTVVANFQYWWGHCQAPVPRLLPTLFDHIYFVKDEVSNLVAVAVGEFGRLQQRLGGDEEAHKVVVVHIRVWEYKDSQLGRVECGAAARALVERAEFGRDCGCFVYFMAPNEVYYTMFVEELRVLTGERDCTSRIVTSWQLLAIPAVESAAGEVLQLETERHTEQFPTRVDWGHGPRYQALFDVLLVRALAPALLLGHYRSSFFTLMAYLAVGEDSKVLSYMHSGASVHRCEALEGAHCDPLNIARRSNTCGEVFQAGGTMHRWRHSKGLVYRAEEV